MEYGFFRETAREEKTAGAKLKLFAIQNKMVIILHLFVSQYSQSNTKHTRMEIVATVQYSKRFTNFLSLLKAASSILEGWSLLP